MIFFAIPFFKNVPFLKETLQSLVNQTDAGWKAVVFDDSIDANEASGAKACVNSFQNPRIAYSKNPKNIGMANNWNRGIEAGQQDVDCIAITILHADDRLLPDYVSEMRKQLQLFPEASAFFCKTRVIDGNGDPVFSFTDYYKNFLLPPREHGLIHLNGVQGIEPLIAGNFIFCPTFCFRKTGLNRLFRPELKMVTDFELTLDLLLNGHILIGLYEKPLFEYRRHGANTTNLLNQNLERFREERELYLDLSVKLKEKNLPALAANAAKLGILRKNLAFLTMTSLLKGHFGLAANYFRYLRNL
jgi:glycosyltransferase involved in cell wall biosynthesis